MSVDFTGESAIREVQLYSSSDEQLYRGRELAWVKNFKRKIKRGVFKEDLAVKGLANNFIPAIVKKYKQEFGQDSIRLTKSEKDQAAKEILPRILEAATYELNQEKEKALKKFESRSIRAGMRGLGGSKRVMA